MATPAKVREQAARARHDALEARLGALTMPGGGGWITAAREAALGRLRAAGLPHKRDEYWKFTDPGPLVQPAPAPLGPGDTHDADSAFGEIDRVQLVFVDGVFDPAQSDDPRLGGVEITRLRDAAHKDLHWARGLYGVLEARGQAPVPRPLATLNTAFARDGVLIRATGRAEKPVSLVYRQARADSDTHIHHCIRVEPGADLTVLENGSGALRTNTVLEVDVATHGAFHHVRVQGGASAPPALAHVFARVARASRFKSFTLTANGVLTRNESVVEVVGDDAVAHVASACLGEGDVHHDDTVFLTHDAARCESRQVVKKVLRDGAVGAFQGKILVRPDAQKTDGYQISQALLLDEDSQFLAKPELEIHADDVACSHGSTSGALDAEGLFYLRARGIPEDQAIDLMILAFLAEAIAEIDDAAIAAAITAHLEALLGTS